MGLQLHLPKTPRGHILLPQDYIKDAPYVLSGATIHKGVDKYLVHNE